MSDMSNDHHGPHCNCAGCLRVRAFDKEEFHARMAREGVTTRKEDPSMDKDTIIYCAVVAVVFIAMLWDALKTKSTGDSWHDHRPKR